jgi:hypothetical protein
MEYSSQIPRCQHIKVNGTQCGSPALRRHRFCFFHKRYQDQRIVLNSASKRRAAIDLPVLEDANSVQVGLMQVIRLLSSGQLDTKTGGLLLYGLQTASFNLRHTTFETHYPTRIVIDPRRVDETRIGGDLWCKEDFPEEEDEEDDDQEEEQDENEDDDATGDSEDGEDDPGAGYSVNG